EATPDAQDDTALCRRLHGPAEVGDATSSDPKQRQVVQGVRTRFPEKDTSPVQLLAPQEVDGIHAVQVHSAIAIQVDTVDVGSVSNVAGRDNLQAIKDIGVGGDVLIGYRANHPVLVC